MEGGRSESWMALYEEGVSTLEGIGGRDAVEGRGEVVRTVVARE